MKAYLDNAATTAVDPKVVEAMLPYFTVKYGNASSLHGLGREAKEALERSREFVAAKINAESPEVVFTSGGSESDNLAVKGVAYAFRKEKNHLITSSIEHPAVLESFKSLEKEGFSVTYLGVDGEGFINLGELEDAISSETSLVSVMHANNEVGTIQDIRAVGKLCAEKGVFFHTDAVQSFTKAPIDVRGDGIALASFSSHKIHGPKGAGALYVRDDLKRKLVKLTHGGHHESGLRAGTENVAGIVGFAKAVQTANAGHVKRMTSLRDRLINNLLKIEETHLNGPRGGKRLCNNANISFHFIEGEGTLLHLDAKGICVSTGSACSSASLKPSHVLTALGITPELAHGAIRFSLSRQNRREEIDYTLESVREVVERLRAMSPLYKMGR